MTTHRAVDTLREPLGDTGGMKGMPAKAEPCCPSPLDLLLTDRTRAVADLHRLGCCSNLCICRTNNNRFIPSNRKRERDGGGILYCPSATQRMESDETHCTRVVSLVRPDQRLPIILRTQKTKGLIEDAIRRMHAMDYIKDVDLVIVLHWFTYRLEHESCLPPAESIHRTPDRRLDHLTQKRRSQEHHAV